MKKRFICLILAIVVIMSSSTMTIVEATNDGSNHSQTDNTTQTENTTDTDEIDVEIVDEVVPPEEDEDEDFEPVYYELPARVLREVNRQKDKYPKIHIGVGIYSLDGKYGYEYNPDERINGGCTVKLPYALFVLNECEKNGIDIYTETITHKASNTHGGSGKIQYTPYGTKYTIYELLDYLLGISDNAAYYMLVSRFPLEDYQKFIGDLGGQKLQANQNGKLQYYGQASVHNRKNEWVAAYKYITSGSLYSDVLRELITDTDYCYITALSRKYENPNYKTYMHKSGWSYGSYSCACDIAIIDERYLVVIMTSVPGSSDSIVSPVFSIGSSIIDKFVKDCDDKGKPIFITD